MTVSKSTAALVVVVVIGALLFLVNFQSGATLVDAAAVGDIDRVAELLQEGHDVDGVGKDDWTPLTVAIENDDESMVRFLLENGADPDKIVPGGTALDMALRRERIGPARVLREFGASCKEYCESDEQR